MLAELGFERLWVSEKVEGGAMLMQAAPLGNGQILITYFSGREWGRKERQTYLIATVHSDGSVTEEVIEGPPVSGQGQACGVRLVRAGGVVVAYGGYYQVEDTVRYIRERKVSTFFRGVHTSRVEIFDIGGQRWVPTSLPPTPLPMSPRPTPDRSRDYYEPVSVADGEDGEQEVTRGCPTVLTVLAGRLLVGGGFAISARESRRNAIDYDFYKVVESSMYSVELSALEGGGGEWRKEQDLPGIRVCESMWRSLGTTVDGRYVIPSEDDGLYSFTFEQGWKCDASFVPRAKDDECAPFGTGSEFAEFLSRGDSSSSHVPCYSLAGGIPSTLLALGPSGEAGVVAGDAASHSPSLLIFGVDCPEYGVSELDLTSGVVSKSLYSLEDPTGVPPYVVSSVWVTHRQSWRCMEATATNYGTTTTRYPE
ncbi:hypothetical protein KIPB_000971 [Kipferlia bialata]|uniref:Uncharacterized protein n=1 Tax=Kipferlia bialata TaxID=797122 RepID=A0A9K3CPM2_9EUKA|nr:hypothetical protein KIPB_000971 [Kipferlia bialata]|eukprot:g971.t1